LTADLYSLLLNPARRSWHRHGRTGQNMCAFAADSRHGITKD